jgi:hypothetical protein
VGHIPYGYLIKNGKAIIDNAKVGKLIALFNAYLSGLSLTDAAKKAGICRCHASIAKMLSDIRYAKDTFYPSVIDEGLFEEVQAGRRRRAEQSGKIREPNEKKVFQVLSFRAPTPQKLYDDPFEQAEYAYSFIECEEATDE